MTKVTIGGKERDLQELTFATIKQIWPVIQSINTVFDDVITTTGCTREEAETAVDPLWQVEQGVRIIAFAIAQDDPAYVCPHAKGTPGYDQDFAYDKVSNELKASEVPHLHPVVTKLMLESGFDNAGPADEGKKPSGELSTETGTDSSLSLSPQDAKEEAGT